MPVAVWLIAGADGAVVYANAQAVSACGWRDRRRRPLHALAKVLSLDSEAQEGGISMRDLNAMIGASGRANTSHAVLHKTRGSTRRVVLCATRMCVPQCSALILLTAIAEESGRYGRTLSTAELARVTAHDLNNIGATLVGFVELASEADRGDPVLAQCFAELRIGHARLAALAGTLELLSEPARRRRGITLQDCMAPPSLTHEPFYVLHPKCDPQIRFRANVDLLQRTLAALAAWAGDDAMAAGFEVTLNATAVTCTDCLSTVAAGSIGFRIAPDKRRPKVEHATQDLVRVAVIQAAHRAGGHVLWKAAAENCFIVFSVSDSARR